MKVFFELTSFALSFINLILISVSLYKIKIKFTMLRMLIILFLTSIFVTITILIPYDFIVLLGYVISFLCVLTLSEDIKHSFEKVISSQILLLILILSITLIAQIFNVFSFDNFEQEKVSSILNSIVLFFIIGLKIGKFKFNVSFSNYTKKEIWLFIMGEISVLIMLFVIMRLVVSTSSWSGLKLTLVIFGISLAFFMYINYYVLKIQFQNQFIKTEKELVLQFLASQENYYLMLLEKEEKTKAFRHDIKNHIICMKHLCESKDYFELKEYLNKLDIFSSERSVTVNTGNNLIDIIISDLKTKYPNVNISVFGCFEPFIKISQIDVCTIFSNLITNSFEAANQSEKKEVKIFIKKLNSNLLVSITNNVAKPPKIQNNTIKSTKQSESHGYGIQNAKTCLNKYEGNVEFSTDEQLFKADIIIPNILEVKL